MLTDYYTTLPQACLLPNFTRISWRFVLPTSKVIAVIFEYVYFFMTVKKTASLLVQEVGSTRPKPTASQCSYGRQTVCYFDRKRMIEIDTSEYRVTRRLPLYEIRLSARLWVTLCKSEAITTIRKNNMST